MKLLNKEQLYDRNKKVAKCYGILSPILYWVLLVLAIACLILTIRHTFGNLKEVLDLLSNKYYTNEQLKQNYAELVAKYGEWTIGDTSKGFQLTFVNLKNVVFNNFAIVNGIMTIVFFLSAICAKKILPILKNKAESDNRELVDKTILKNN